MAPLTMLQSRLKGATGKLFAEQYMSRMGIESSCRNPRRYSEGILALSSDLVVSFINGTEHSQDCKNRHPFWQRPGLKRIRTRLAGKLIRQLSQAIGHPFTDIFELMLGLISVSVNWPSSMWNFAFSPAERHPN